MSVFRGSLWLLAARLGALALALVALLLARKLGSDGFGAYAFFTTVIFIANVLTTCGTDMYFIREIAARDDLSRLPAALWIQLGLSGLAIAVVMIFAPLWPGQRAEGVLALQIYSLSLIPQAFYGVFTIALRGKQRMDSYAALNFAVALLQALAVLFFVAWGDGLVMLAWLLLLAQLVSAFVAGGLCFWQLDGFGRGWHVSWLDVRSVFMASVALGLLGLLGMFYQKAGLLLVSLLGGAALTGLYASALKLVDVAKMAHIATLTALYPLMAQDSASRTLSLAWKGLLALALLLAVIFTWLAEPLVSLLFGPAFASAAPVLRLLAWALIPYTVSAYLSLAFVARSRPQPVGWALTGGIISLGFFSLGWIPAYGLAGAAAAALSAESLQAFLLLIFWHFKPFFNRR